VRNQIESDVGDVGAQPEDVVEAQVQEDGDRRPVLVVGKEEIERLARLEPVEELEDVPEEPEVAIEVEKDDEPEHERDVVGGGRQLFEPLAEEAKRGTGRRGSRRLPGRRNSASG
jgi:hypothetical protein